MRRHHLLVAFGAFEVLGLLVLNEHLLEFKATIAVVAKGLEVSLARGFSLLAAHSSTIELS